MKIILSEPDGFGCGLEFAFDFIVNQCYTVDAFRRAHLSLPGDAAPQGSTQRPVPLSSAGIAAAKLYEEGAPFAKICDSRQ